MENHQNQFFCDICQVSLNSKHQFDSHMSGKLHLRSVNAKSLPFNLDITTISKSAYKCNVCNVLLNGIVPVRDHLHGIVHFIKKERLHNKIIFDDDIEIDNNNYFCKVCNISCSGHIPMQNHISGVLHTKNTRICLY